MGDLTPKQARFVQAKTGPFYVYELVDPRTGTAFYVGKGKGRRAWAHESAVRHFRERNGLKAEVIAQLHSEGLRPEVRIVSADMIEADAFRLERKMITARRDELTNISGGAHTAQEASEAAAKAYLQRVKPFDVWAGERPRSDIEVGMYHRIVEELRKIADGLVPLEIVF